MFCLKELAAFNCKLGQIASMKEFNNTSRELDCLNLSHNDLQDSLDIIFDLGLFTHSLGELILVNCDLKDHHFDKIITRISGGDLTQIDISNNQICAFNALHHLSINCPLIESIALANCLIEDGSPFNQETHLPFQ